jgi:hypothetical protein
MATVRHIPIAEAQQMRRPKAPGVRRARMNEFNEYVRVLLDNPDAAAVYEDIEGPPHNFVLSLRGAFKRAGIAATVRKMKARNEVRAWLIDADEDDVPAVSTHQHRERELVAV